MHNTLTIDKKDTDDMRRIRKPIWVDPKKARGGPTIGIEAAMKMLGYKARKPIYLLTERGPERGGFPGYVPSQDGNGWIRKTVPALTEEQKQERKKLIATLSKAERDELRTQPQYRDVLYEAHGGHKLMFYEEDIRAWAEANPVHMIGNPKKKPVTYTDQERDYVLWMVQRERANGPVYRTRLREKLETINYCRVKFLDGQVLTGWLVPTSPDVATLFVDKDKHYSLIIPTVEIEVLKKGNTEGAWNVRGYPKLKKILDDNGIPLEPLPITRKRSVG